MVTPTLDIETLIAGASYDAARTVDAYEDSAEEVGHPEGQPIVETFPQLEGLVANGMRDLVAQQREAAADPRRIAAEVVKELPLAGITARQYGRYTEAVAEGARRALASVGLT